MKKRVRQIKKVSRETWPNTTPCTVVEEHDSLPTPSQVSLLVCG